MKFKIKLILSFLMVNSIIGDEVRQLSFLNENCDGIPYATYANTLCSPEGLNVIYNETKLNIRSSESKQDCKVNKDNLEPYGEIINLNQCNILSDSSENSYDIYEIVVDKKTVSSNINNNGLESSYSSYSESNSESESTSTSSSYDIPSFSYVFTYTNSRFPTMVKGYCNQIKLYDCENYQVYSFKNDSCFSNSDSISSYPYFKQMCRGDSILTFKCEECASNSLETCILDNTEPSNLSKCPNIGYTTIEKLLKEIKYIENDGSGSGGGGGNEDHIKSKKSVDDIENEESSLLNKISIKKIEDTKQPYNHIIEVESDKKNNSSSFLFSNSILILFLLVLSLF
ncbi:hypothetical protein ACTA71_011927 [Dictyostelium dimigraforme]